MAYAPRTAKRVQAHYLETLDALEFVLSKQPFILGQRPTLADYGLYGSMFRHFFCDPTPARIMGSRAPAVHEWVARLWNTHLHEYSTAPFQDHVTDSLKPLMGIVSSEFIPYQQANEEACNNGKKQFEFNSKGTPFKLPVQQYRAWRFQRLRTRYQTLDPATQQELNTCFPELGAALGMPVTCPIKGRIQGLPISTPTQMTSRTW